MSQLTALAHSVFTNAFVDAMRPTLLLPIAVLVLAAVACLAVRGQQAQAVEAPAGEPVAAA